MTEFLPYDIKILFNWLDFIIWNISEIQPVVVNDQHYPRLLLDWESENF